MSRKQIVAALAIVGVIAAIAVVALSYERPSTINLHKKMNSRFTEEEREFINFIAKHRKNYFNREEYNYRLAIFAANFQTVAAHNKRTDVTHSLGINHFADLDTAEFKRMYTGTYNKPSAQNVKTLSTGNLAATIDWVTKGAVTPVKNQGQCGSCWSFSATGSLEGMYFLSTGNLLSFSEQELVDCSGSYGNNGCNGGLMDYAFQYVEKYGLASEASYSYTAMDGTCHRSSHARVLPAGFVGSYHDVTRGSVSQMTAALNIAPVSIAIEADQSSFQYYTSGVVSTGCGQQLDHGVLAVGYGTTSAGQAYWLVKNSWGSSWGANGYVKILKSSADECGVLLSASYPNHA